MAAITQPEEISETAPSKSDVGGVPARHGFKYQDHIAAKHFIEMLTNVLCVRMECETADDILVVWQNESQILNEYIQVKTTENDSRKWSIKELTDRSNKNTPSSVAEASLLCDKYEAKAMFRVVTLRAVNRSLLPLTIPFSERTDICGVDKLAEVILKKRKTTRSENGNNLEYWVQNAFWDVTGDKASVEAKNLIALSEVCDRYGAIPDHAQLKDLYAKILNWVDEAAEASRRTSPSKKIISRVAAEQWVKGQTATVIATRSQFLKPYRYATPNFFTVLTTFSEEDIKRSMSSYDVEFELKRWRSRKLADYLVQWIPEISLKASEIVSADQFSWDEKFSSAITQITKDTSLDYLTIMSETLLHAIIRNFFDSEPIACKIFSGSTEGIRHFGNAHIVHGKCGDELWLGRSSVVAAREFSEICDQIVEDLKKLLHPDIFLKEKDIIISLREPQHLLPTNLEDAFDRGVPFDRLLSHICIPILIGYDSSVLKDGFSDSYKEALIREVKEGYDELKGMLPSEVDEHSVKVHLIAVPIECAATLFKQFETKLRSLCK
ncbi:Hachiman antiphage defense system protein HamA [Ruegeria sp. EL01]|uniref:HamA C-terminal domain-containing protein n=1 Tax=Ruegeria sp. EL01 TaxID=2107578 RepID=UPI001C1F4736|nr:Hachiman antiphage defense system protein HamA [Ruegeria sp. EL01]